MTSRTSIVIGIVVIVLVGGFLFWQSGTANAPVTQTDSTAQTGDSSQQGAGAADTSGAGGEAGAGNGDGGTLQVFTTAEVALHATRSSCWTTIDDGVYDLTSWISRHPGGAEAILSLCGKDGTAAFRAQHDSNQKQADILATMLIGTASR